MSDTDKQVSAEAPSTSPVDKKTPESTAEGTSVEGSQPQATAKPTVTEESWNTLKGSTQDRIRTLIRERNELRDQQTRQVEYDSKQVATTNPDLELQTAVKRLKEEGGMASKEDLDALYWTMKANAAHSQLEKEFDGSAGAPEYIREEVEDYARKEGLGLNYRAAYRDMYFDEIVDARKTRSKKRVVTERPTGVVAEREQPVTLEGFRKKLKGSKGREYYEKLSQNPRAFNELLQQLSE